MADIDAKTMEKLAKLLPMLSTSHDGELVATSRAIMRTLKASGFDMHDVVSALSKQRKVRIVEKPVYRERVVERKVYVERIVEVEKIIYRDAPAGPAATKVAKVKQITAPDVGDYLGIYRESHNVINVARTNLSDKEIDFMKQMRSAAFNKHPMTEKQYLWWKRLIEREMVTS